MADPIGTPATPQTVPQANGMLELREDGLLKILEGMTTPDEVMRVVFTAGF